MGVEEQLEKLLKEFSVDTILNSLAAVANKRSMLERTDENPWDDLARTLERLKLFGV